VVDQPECIGCNLCFHVCPVEGCIEMIQLNQDAPKVSWNELVARGGTPAGFDPAPSSEH
jgi:dihydropyrimidine dehydrogenase (NAD+) subunit PreA